MGTGFCSTECLEGHVRWLGPPLGATGRGDCHTFGPVITGIHSPQLLPPSSWELQATTGLLQQENPL